MKKQRVKLSSVILVLIVIFSVLPIKTYALDDSCLTSRSYWNDCESIINYSDTQGLTGFAKYITDSSGGCFYFYINFCDNAIKDGVNDRIFFRFNIENSKDSISFDVDGSGIDEKSGSDISQKVEVISNFDSVSCRNKGGKAIIAFELKDKSYRTELNKIECQYYCGSSINHKVFDCIELDMRKEEATKNTTQKAEKTTQKAATTAKEKSTSAKERSTKFTPKKETTASTVKGSSEKATRFDAEGYSAADNTESDSEYWSSVLEQGTENIESSTPAVQSELSDRAKNLIITAIVLIAAGIVLTLAGLTAKTKSQKPKDE
ncbi:MAG: hypothetical protein ACI4IK_07960 [Eubacterium sp.]